MQQPRTNAKRRTSAESSPDWETWLTAASAILTVISIGVFVSVLMWREANAGGRGRALPPAPSLQPLKSIQNGPGVNRDTKPTPAPEPREQRKRPSLPA